MMISYANIKALYGKKGYPFYSSEFDLNLFGFRNQSPVVDTFDDILGAAWIDADGKGNCAIFSGTTKPGIDWLQNPMAATGTAIVKAGYYPSLWTPGDHHGYRALVQNGDVTVYRDNNRDGKIDLIPGTEETGNFGINMHHAGLTDGDEVGKYSAGCQVFTHIADFNFIMSLVDAQIKAGIASTFSYALFNNVDMVG